MDLPALPNLEPTVTNGKDFNILITLDQLRDAYQLLTPTDINIERISINEDKFIRIYKITQESNFTRPLLRVKYKEGSIIITDRNVIPDLNCRFEVFVYSDINDFESLGEF